MKNKGITRTLLGAGLLTLACGVMMAQDAKLFPHQSITKGSNIIHPADAPPANFIKLYSNLGSKTDTYYESSGWTISGPTSGAGLSQNIGSPYTPSADSTILGLQLALTHVENEGTNAVAVAIFTDANGVPGKPLKVWNPQNLPNFGDCCTLVTVTDSTGVKVKAGTQYWIVAGTDTLSATSWDVWDFTWNQIQGTVAFAGSGNGNVWTTFTGTVPAYAIYGSTP
jgi:hypothetical protein